MEKKQKEMNLFDWGSGIKAHPGADKKRELMLHMRGEWYFSLGLGSCYGSWGFASQFESLDDGVFSVLETVQTVPSTHLSNPLAASPFSISEHRLTSTDSTRKGTLCIPEPSRCCKAQFCRIIKMKSSRLADI